MYINYFDQKVTIYIDGLEYQSKLAPRSQVVEQEYFSTRESIEVIAKSESGKVLLKKTLNRSEMYLPNVDKEIILIEIKP